MEKLKPYLGQFLLQVSLAGMNILVRLSLKDGLNHFVLVTYRLAVATATIVPFAYVFERKQRPPLSWTILFQIFCLACGLTISQNCYFQGLYYTSSTFGSAALNLVPVFTFVLALLIRLEKVDIKTLRGQAKVVGTVICVGGAMVMTFYKGPPITNPSSTVDKKENNLKVSNSDTNNMALGSILVFGGTLAWSAWITFQGPVLKRYPAQLSFTALISLIGSVQSVLIAILSEHRKWDVWTIPSNIQLVTIFYTGIISGGLAFFVQAWCIQKKGPVFAGVFSPLCTLATALLEFSILHVSLYTGSVVGAIVIVVGLYSALWGKAKEHGKTDKVSTADRNFNDNNDVEKKRNNTY